MARRKNIICWCGHWLAVHEDVDFHGIPAAYCIRCPHDNKVYWHVYEVNNLKYLAYKHEQKINANH